MKEINTYTFPDGQQLADGESVQLLVKRNGRMIFQDAYFADLQEGDVYMIPEQVELAPETDTDILDFIIDNNITWHENHFSWEKTKASIFFFDDGQLFKRFDYVIDENIGKPACRRGAIRDGLNEIIQNLEL
jgi:hypothetical protein